MDQRNVEDMFALTGLQQSLLIHHLQRTHSDSGLLQLRGTIKGSLEIGRFEQAWREVVSRHPALRTSVHWKNLSHPVQVVARKANPSVHLDDWSNLTQEERDSRLAGFLREEGRGLDLETAPVMRLALLRFTTGHHEFIWTCHHILLDGWSGSIVLGEVLDTYAALGRQPPDVFPPPRPFKDYATWLAQRDEAPAREFWAQRLARHPDDTRLGPRLSPNAVRVPNTGAREVALDKVSAEAIESWARATRVTANTLFLGCWALLLAGRTGRHRPTFGVTLSGRAADFPGLDQMVGMFANTLPLILDVTPSQAVPEFFRAVLGELQGLQEFEHATLGQVLQWGGVASTLPLFDSILVYANFPGGAQLAGDSSEASAREDGTLRFCNFQGDVTSAYPLSIIVKPGSPFALEARFDRNLFPADEIKALLVQLQTLIEGVICTHPETLRSLLDLVPPVAPPANVPTSPTLAPPNETSGNGAGQIVPAANSIEAHLMRMWDDFFEVEQIGRDDNFFDLGGHSLLVPLLIERIRNDFRVELPLSGIFGAPTIRKLAALIESLKGTDDWKCLVGIRRSGTRPPLYLVHGLLGEIGYFYNLAGYLTEDQPVYGLQGPAEPFADIGTIAAHYLTEIREQQSHGPYRIGGYCLGGAVAFEIVRQLRSSGEDVELLLLIDSAPPSYRPDGAPQPPDNRSLSSRLRRLTTKSPTDLLSAVTWRVKRVLDPSSRAYRNDTIPEAFWGVAERHSAAFKRYEPRPCRCNAVLLRCEDQDHAADLGWGPLIEGELQIVTVNAPHVDILKEPYLADTARKLSEVLSSLPHHMT